ncbi:hypothetical protein PR048_019367 [Dryococelus australis]|uniref:ARID domain-containing protein n=1 Tax=Dryococelus australis TaxID=614101 RepID=A0ABQ9H3L9_9NEOP|nr:hypothetical protein PR048_019367 [Dryococelus australis]
MAKILNKDPATYQRERECFLRDLQQFHETRGTPFRKIPKINGHEIDLYLLYVLVTAHGGWVKVRIFYQLLVLFTCSCSCLCPGSCIPRYVLISVHIAC